MNKDSHIHGVRVRHRAWSIALACAVMAFCSCFLLGGVGVLLAALRAHVGLTGAQTSLIPTVRGVVAFFLTLGSRHYYKRFGLRGGMTLAMLAGAGTCLIFLLANGSMPFYLLGGALSGVVYAFGLTLSMSMLLKRWFAKMRSIALSIASAGLPLSILVGSSLIEWVIEAHGLSAAFLLEASLYLCAAALIAAVVRDSPSQLGLEPYGANAGEDVSQRAAAAPAASQAGLGEGWLLVLAAACFLDSFAVSPATGHFALLFNDDGFDPMLAANAVSVYGATYLVSAPTYGLVSTRISHVRATALYGGTLAVALAMASLVGYMQSVPFMFVAMALVGVGFPVVMQGYPTWAADLTDDASYDRTLHRFQLGYQLGSMMGTPLPGIVADLTGDYSWAYAGYAVVFVLIVGIVLAAYAARGRLAAE